MVNHLFPSLVAKQAQRRQEAINAHLVLSLAQLLLGVLEGTRGKGGDLTTQRAVEMPLSAVGCSNFHCSGGPSSRFIKTIQGVERGVVRT